MKHLYTSSLSERDIVSFQEYFLLPGLHEVTLHDEVLDRIFLHKLLKTVNYFSRGSYGMLFFNTQSNDLSAELTTDGMVNIYDELDRHTSQQADGLEGYLLTDFYYDLLVIELSPRLEQLSWFKKFLNLLVSLNLTETISVLLISYS